MTAGSCFAGVSSPQSCIARLQLEKHAGTRCTMDLDGSNTTGASSDGVLLMRMLLGLSGQCGDYRRVVIERQPPDGAGVRDHAGLHCRLRAAP